MSGAEHRRLDSWKEIAEYLARDRRTVARWEKESGLPIHRVGGRLGRSVFAYTDEIDKWLARYESLHGPDTPDQSPTRELHPDVQNEIPRRTFKTLSPRSVLLVASLGLAALILAVAVILPGRTQNSSPNPPWTSFLAEHSASRVVDSPVLADLDGDGKSEAYVCLANDAASPDGKVIGSHLVRLSDRGAVIWRFEAQNRVRFGSKVYEGPWIAQKWATIQGPSGPQLALAVRDFTLWPAILVTLDAQRRITGEFVNAGWISALETIQNSRSPYLLAGGISNSRDAGMLAVLGLERITGSSPEEPGSEYECQSCPEGRPHRYFIFPRSELNRVAPSAYNKVNTIDLLPGRVVVHTDEIASRPGQDGIDGIYEFTPDMEVKTAYFNDKYWDLHRRLELERRIFHSRNECPDRFGPSRIQAWSPESGWEDIRLPLGSARGQQPGVRH